MSFFVKFWGTRGSIPTPGWQTRKYGGNTPCVEIRIGDTLYICDGGTGLRELGIQLLKEQKESIVAHLFFSHPHWDHIQGFPFFTPAYIPSNTFYIYGTDPGDTRYFDVLSGQMGSDYFPVKFSDLGAQILPRFLGKEGSEIEGVHISWFRQVHPGGSLAYKFIKGDHCVVYATDNELDLELVNKEEADADSEVLRQVSPAYLDFIRGADLLIADGQYTDEEYPQKVGFGHPRATTVVDAAAAAGVKNLAICHFDPMLNDEAIDESIHRCRLRAQKQASNLMVFGAREKVELRIDD